MANFLGNEENYEILIPSYENVEKVTYYKVVMKVGDVNWFINHRYKDFVQLHEILVSEHSVAKDILPPKKIFGAKEPEFIEKRKIALEIYLRNVVNFLRKAVPPCLIHFLDLYKYDILCIIQELASFCCVRGDQYISHHSNYGFTPLQLYAISRRLKQACPLTEIYNKQYNFSHILDFCNHLTTVTIKGGNHCIGTSNIISNKLPFELSIFKSCTNLHLYNIKLENIYDLGTIRETVICLVVCNCNVTNLVDILLCDKVHKNLDNLDAGAENIYTWSNLASVDASWNEIEEIGKELHLVPRLHSLTVDGNKLTSLPKIDFSLQCVCYFSAAANNININKTVGEIMPNLMNLRLSKNKTSTLWPYANLQKLISLELASNLITDIEEIKYISKLPCLEFLVLTANPVASIINYRVKVFEYFEEKADYLCLDNERASQKELDTASVLRALTIVKEGRAPL